MKKEAFFIVVLLASCQFFPERNTPVKMDVFTINEQCPYVCWLGINPGRTTLEEASKLLLASSQIDKNKLMVYGDSAIDAVWYERGFNSPPSHVEIEFRNGTVSSIFFNIFHFSTNDFVTLLGEPEIISLSINSGVEADFFNYALYFPVQKVLLYSYPKGIEDGPQPDDLISKLILNTDVYDYTFPSTAGELQAWLGYGHMKEYLQGQELPAGFILPGP